jgi:hypothetical protein
LVRNAGLVALIVLAVGDGVIVYLLILFSEMVFGQHEGLHGAPAAVAGWSIALIAGVGAPIAGFVLWAYRKPGVGITVAVLPIVGALLLLAS